MKRRSFLKGTVKSLLAFGGIGAASEGVKGAEALKNDPYMRPPGAIRETEFLVRCIRCFRCGEACPKTSIKFAGPSIEKGETSLFDRFSVVARLRKRTDHPLVAIDTPYIEPWDKECALCMECTEACPTGALQEIDSDKETVQEEVDMGTAKVDKKLCFSWNAYAQWHPEQTEFERIEDYPGFSCGLCFNQCPYRGEALQRKSLERPVVDEDKCVGCGTCERTCPAGNGSSGDPTEIFEKLAEESDGEIVPPAIKVEPNDDRGDGRGNGDRRSKG